MPQSKKETKARKVKPKAAAAGKTPATKPMAKNLAAKKPKTTKKTVSKTTSEKLKTATTRKKVVEKASKSKKTENKKTENKKPDRHKPSRVEVDSHSATPVSQAQTPQMTQRVDSKPASVGSGLVRERKKETELADSISQGLAKQGQKKRGWRDIEALAERARLKSLLSDIWHEDIDLDSDIFGETDHLTGYYTDKEEEIEVEDDDDEEWEEFEEDED